MLLLNAALERKCRHFDEKNVAAPEVVLLPVMKNFVNMAIFRFSKWELLLQGRIQDLKFGVAQMD